MRKKTRKILITALIITPYYVIIYYLASLIDETGEVVLSTFVVGLGLFIATYLLVVDKYIK